VAELNELIRKIKVLNVHSKVTQRVLQSVHTDTDRRIFKEGRSANGKALGTYSKGYQRTRRKGIIYVSKGKKERNTYPGITKINLQARGDMNRDYVFLVLADGNYGSGFNNDFNAEKSEWVESTYKKPIFRLTRSEEKSIGVRMDKELTRFLSRL
jgi:hypothetical protein